MKYYFIVNPKAGKKDSRTYFMPMVEKYLNNNNIDYEICVTEYAGHGAKLAQDIIENTKDKIRVIAVGGDGTIHEVAQACINQPNVSLGLLPCGSGNDFLKSFGSQEEFFDLDALINGKDYLIDVIYSNYKSGINICSVGLDAKICTNIERYKKLPFISGSVTYNLSVVKELLGKLGDELEIVVDDEKIYKDKYLFAVVANGKCYGGGYNPTPNALLDDGLLDCVLIKVPSKIQLPALVNAYKKGTYLTLPIADGLITTFRCKKVSIRGIKQVDINFDGEIINNLQIDFEVLPKALKIIVPKNCKVESLINYL